MNPLSGYGIVLVTAASQAEGQQIATTLVELKLAACVTLMPVQSLYTWENQVHFEQEWQLMIKTDLAQFSAIEAKIQELHSYVVPEIIAIPLIAGSQAYLSWIGRQLSGTSYYSGQLPVTQVNYLFPISDNFK